MYKCIYYCESSIIIQLFAAGLNYCNQYYINNPHISCFIILLWWSVTDTIIIKHNSAVQISKYAKLLKYIDMMTDCRNANKIIHLHEQWVMTNENPLCNHRDFMIKTLYGRNMLEILIDYYTVYTPWLLRKWSDLNGVDLNTIYIFFVAASGTGYIKFFFSASMTFLKVKRIIHFNIWLHNSPIISFRFIKTM